MGIGIQVEGLTKSFGPQRIWEDVTFDLPAGEVSVLLGPSGTGKSVFLKSLIGLLRPERGKIIVDGTNIIECSAKELYEIRTLFGVMFQDGALFGSMSLYDNTAFPLREHTKKKESEIRQIVMEKLDLVGLTGDEVSLAIQFWYPQTVDDVGRGEPEFDLCIGRDINFVGGNNIVVRVSNFPPPTMTDDFDGHLGIRVNRGKLH